MGLDIKELDKISKWFNKSQLTSATIEYSVNGDYKLTLSRDNPAHDRTTGPVQPMMHMPMDYSNDIKSVGLTKQQKDTYIGAEEEKESADSITLEDIVSPIIGTFYRSSSPDSPPLIQVGETVKQGSILCILEAMKVMNELEADFDMEIVEILVENAQMVEYGQALFKVKRV